MTRTMKALLVALTALAACSDDGPTGPTGSGTFDMQVTGAVQATVDGVAFFGLQGQPGSQSFALLLTNENQDHVVITGYAGTTRPAVGTYDISPDDWELIYLYSQSNTLLATFFALEGQIVITESAARQLTGTITFSATGTLNGEEQVVNGTVTFDARPAS